MKTIIGTIFIAPFLLVGMHAATAQSTTKSTVDDPNKISDIPIITLKKPGAATPASVPSSVIANPIKAGETIEAYTTRTATNPEVMCFMTLGAFSAIAGQNTKGHSEEEIMMLARVDAATDFFMGRTTATLSPTQIEPAMKKAGALISPENLKPLIGPCITYYDKKYAPIAAQIRHAPKVAPK